MKNRKNIINAFAIAIIASVVFLTAGSASAAWGDYDTTFGFLGASLDAVTNHYPKHIALQSDGKIVMTGYRLVSGRKRMFLRRYLSNGQIDTAFGNNGAAVSNALIITAADYYGSQVAIQADGTIAVVGSANGTPAVWRFKSDGYSDSSVGYGGIKVLSGYSIPPSDGVKAEPQGSAVVIAVLASTRSSQEVVLLRLGRDGRLDESFGIGGKVKTGFYGNPFDMIVERPGGSISVGGPRSSQIHISGIDRWTADGQIDYGFVFAGTSTGSFVPSSFVKLPNGKYAMPMWTAAWLGIPATARLLQFESHGPFESAMVYESGNATESDCPRILAVQQDGKLLVNGLTQLKRFNTDLSTFESNNCSNYVSTTDKTRAILQSDDKMIVAGRYGGYIAMVRTLPD